MQTIRLPYGDGFQTASIPDHLQLQIIDPPVNHVETPLETMLEAAMDHPFGTPPLNEIAVPEDTVVIVMNDHTRPGPNRLILDAIMRRLEQAGIPDSHITVLFATGSHRAPTKEEAARIMGETYFKRLKSAAHDCRDEAAMICIGSTSGGVPVYVNRLITECSLLITTGLIAPIHTAGYSGGRKSILPGVAGLKTLHIHHSFPVYQYEPAMGFIYGNPFHEIALDAAKKANVRFMVNAVQDPHKQFFNFVAGDLEQAHAAGVAMCKEVSEVHIPLRGDIIIASPGGFPRDIDLYQSQKALSVAEMMGTRDCTFIIVAECRDGFGEATFRSWMVQCPTVQSIIDRYAEEGFNVGNNKAFNYARALKKGRVIIVTDKISAKELADAKLESASSLQEALEMSLAARQARVVTVMAQAANIIPIVDQPAAD
ncbi:MAG: nickel-dependent lactate racemase [Clostridium sp.]|nr:nickel-dependent lactate racemase [Clostridium sp.]